MADVTSRNPSSSTSSNKNANPTGGGDGQKKHIDLNVRDPDAFQGSMVGAWAWLEDNANAVFALFALLIVGAIGYSVMNWWGKHEEKKAQESFYQIEHQYTKIKEDFELGKMRASLPKSDKPDDLNKVGKIASGDLSKDYGTVISDFEKLARDNPKTSAGAQAAIIAASIYLSYNQPDKAADVIQIPVKNLGEKQLLANLARDLWGSALATKGDCKTAIATWKPLIDTAAAAFLAGDASLRSGLCFETLGQADEARKMYEKVSNSKPLDAGASETAKILLRALDLKTNANSASPQPTQPTKG